jgi:hypothetical protein
MLGEEGIPIVGGIRFREHARLLDRLAERASTSTATLTEALASPDLRRVAAGQRAATILRLNDDLRRWFPRAFAFRAGEFVLVVLVGGPRAGADCVLACERRGDGELLCVAVQSDAARVPELVTAAHVGSAGFTGGLASLAGGDVDIICPRQGHSCTVRVHGWVDAAHPGEVIEVRDGRGTLVLRVIPFPHQAVPVVAARPWWSAAVADFTFHGTGHTGARVMLAQPELVRVCFGRASIRLAVDGALWLRRRPVRVRPTRADRHRTQPRATGLVPGPAPGMET